MALREEQTRWDQEALRPPRWSWLRRRPHHEAPNPFEDQDLFDGFVGSLRGRIKHQLERRLDDPVQLEIAYLVRLLRNMPRAIIYKNRAFFEMAFDLLAAEQPNLVLVAQIRQGIYVSEAQSTRIGRLIIGRTAIQTVIAGICSTFILLFVAIVLLDQLHWILQQLGSPLEQLPPIAQLIQRMPIAQIIVLVVAACTGAVVSVLARLHCFLDAARAAPLLCYITVATKPLVSIAFATFIYAVMRSGLVALPELSLDGPNGNYIVWAVGFLSGFSERFVQDFVAQADRIVAPPTTVTGGSTARKDPAQ